MLASLNIHAFSHAYKTKNKRIIFFEETSRVNHDVTTSTQHVVVVVVDWAATSLCEELH